MFLYVPFGIIPCPPYDRYPSSLRTYQYTRTTSPKDDNKTDGLLEKEINARLQKQEHPFEHQPMDGDSVSSRDPKRKCLHQNGSAFDTVMLRGSTALAVKCSTIPCRLVDQRIVQLPQLCQPAYELSPLSDGVIWNYWLTAVARFDYASTPPPDSSPNPA
jgi:hypothetical protein